MTIIGFAGLKGAGKDTAASVLVSEHGFTNLKMAGGLKAMTHAYLGYCGVPSRMASELVDGKLKESGYYAFNGQSARYFQQKLGTEFGRKFFGPDFWVDAFLSRADLFNNVVCTDVRFPNEVAAIQSLGGKVYLIDNKRAVPEDVIFNPSWIDHLRVGLGLTKKTIAHPSERYVLSLDVDGVLDNNGDIEHLHRQVISLV